MSRPTKWSIVRRISVAAALALGVAAVGPARAADEPVKAFNGKDTAGWKTTDAKAAGNWKVAGDAKMDEKNNKALVAVGEPKDGQAALVLEKAAHGSDLYTEQAFGDCEVHVEFMVPKGSNSGVYLMGQYEVQVLDSFGKKDADLKPGDVGGVYNTKAPSKNAAKAPGEWQSFDIVFKAPRFDKDGKKTASAVFVNVKLNGVTIHENVEAPKPTGGQLPGGEKPTGPLMFQGDHGPVAFRNVTVKPIALR
ncbi:MAG TPA: DUF1080 domain-containing protein [Humisphaera sp.]